MAELELNKNNFDTEVLESDIPVLVDFWASWCGPCRMLAPFVAQVAGEYEGRAKVGKVNVDDEPELARRYGIMSIPALLLFKNGDVADRRVGFRPRGDIEDMIDEWL